MKPISPCRSTPKALRLPAQGCEERATLGPSNNSASSIGAGLFGGRTRFPHSIVLFLLLTLTGCTPFLSSGPKGPPKYPVTRETFRQASVHWTSTDNDNTSNYLLVLKNHQLEAGVRTREVGRKTITFTISDATFDALLAALNRAQLRENTLFASHIMNPMLEVSLATSEGRVSNWYGHKKGTPASRIARFFDQHLWPEVYRRVHAAGLTRLPMRDAPTLPLPEIAPPIKPAPETR
jgi:hypothetical protein